MCDRLIHLPPTMESSGVILSHLVTLPCPPNPHFLVLFFSFCSLFLPSNLLFLPHLSPAKHLEVLLQRVPRLELTLLMNSSPKAGLALLLRRMFFNSTLFCPCLPSYYLNKHLSVCITAHICAGVCVCVFDARMCRAQIAFLRSWSVRSIVVLLGVSGHSTQ